MPHCGKCQPNRTANPSEGEGTARTAEQVQPCLAAKPQHQKDSSAMQNQQTKRMSRLRIPQFFLRSKALKNVGWIGSFASPPKPMSAKYPPKNNKLLEIIIPSFYRLNNIKTEVKLQKHSEDKKQINEKLQALNFPHP